MEPLYKEAVEEVAAFVGAQPDNIVIVVIVRIMFIIILWLILMIVLT